MCGGVAVLLSRKNTDAAKGKTTLQIVNKTVAVEVKSVQSEAQTKGTLSSKCSAVPNTERKIEPLKLGKQKSLTPSVSTPKKGTVKKRSAIESKMPTKSLQPSQQVEGNDSNMPPPRPKSLEGPEKVPEYDWVRVVGKKRMQTIPKGLTKEQQKLYLEGVNTGQDTAARRQSN